MHIARRKCLHMLKTYGPFDVPATGDFARVRIQQIRYICFIHTYVLVEHVDTLSYAGCLVRRHASGLLVFTAAHILALLYV